MASEAPAFYLVDEEHHAEGGTLLGFWIYLMSDALIFATLFATFGVLHQAYAGGPTPNGQCPPERTADRAARAPAGARSGPQVEAGHGSQVARRLSQRGAQTAPRHIPPSP